MQSRYLVFWNNCFGAGSWSCTLLQVPSHEGNAPLRIHDVEFINLVNTKLYALWIVYHSYMNSHGLHVYLYVFFLLQVLLMTLQNSPPGLDLERDKKFSKVSY